MRLDSRQTIHSKDFDFESPPQPFESVESAQVDRLFVNKSNGNTISLMSDCYNPVDPSLDNLQKGILRQVDNVEVLEMRHLTYNDRAALHTLAEGVVDGVKSRMEFLLFKKNHCVYILNYLGVAEKFGDDQRKFHKFIKGLIVK